MCFWDVWCTPWTSTLHRSARNTFRSCLSRSTPRRSWTTMLGQCFAGSIRLDFNRSLICLWDAMGQATNKWVVDVHSWGTRYWTTAIYLCIHWSKSCLFCGGGPSFSSFVTGIYPSTCQVTGLQVCAAWEWDQGGGQTDHWQCLGGVKCLGDYNMEIHKISL